MADDINRSSELAETMDITAKQAQKTEEDDSETKLTDTSVDLQKSRSTTELRTFVTPGIYILLFLYIYGPICIRLIQDLWNDAESSHGLLVLPVSAYLIWRKRTFLATLPKVPNRLAFALVGFGVLLLPLSIAASIGNLAYISMFLVLTGSVWHIWGGRVMRAILFPVLFIIFFAVPWPGLLIETATFPLQLLAARLATSGMALLGIDAIRDGVNIRIEKYLFSVAAPCSGMHSLAALFALGALYAYLLQGHVLRRFVLAAVPPLALAGNAIRIIVILLIALKWGQEAADGFFHKFSGIVVFLITFLLLLFVGRILKLRQLREDF